MRALAPSDVLAHVAELLLAACTPDTADALVGVSLAEGGVELHLCPAEAGYYVGELLFGFDAPADWFALGLVARARAYPLDHGRSRAEPVLVVHLQARSGQSHSVLSPPLASTPPPGDLVEGRLADLCRRCLGLPNRAPVDSPLAWWAARWLDLLCGAPAIERVTSAAELVELFPGGTPFGAERSLASLREHGRLLAASCPWPSLRAAAASGTIGVPGPAGAYADWLDDASFARWALDELPPFDVLLAELQPRLQPSLHAEVTGVLVDWALWPSR